MAGKSINKGVVLAAGDGGRLSELTSRTPKVLLPVLGKPLILYPIEALIRAGIREIAVVIGYLGNKVEEFLYGNPLPEVSLCCIFNPYHQHGNAASVEAAADWVDGEPFVLCMGDHIMRQDYISRFLDKVSHQETLGVDFKPGSHHILEEAMKVCVDGDGLISDIGKELTQWDGIDTGVFLITETFINAAGELRKKSGIDTEISEVIRFMLDRGQDFVTCDTTGPFWADIDTAEDIQLVSSAGRWLRTRCMTG